MSTDIRLKDHNSQEEAPSRHNKKTAGKNARQKGIWVQSTCFTAYRKHLSQHFCNFTEEMSLLHLLSSATPKSIDRDDRRHGRGRYVVYLFNKEGQKLSAIACTVLPSSIQQEAEDVIRDPTHSSAVYLSTACWVLGWYLPSRTCWSSQSSHPYI